MPPSFLFLIRLFKLSPGGVLLLFQRKSHMIVWSDLVIVFGIPCAFVRNCIISPTTI